MLAGQLNDRVQVVACERVAGGIVRKVDHEHTGAVGKAVFQLIQVQLPGGMWAGCQAPVDQFAANRTGDLVQRLVGRGNGNYLVSRPE